MFRFFSPSLVVSIVALIVALGGAGYSATGGNFILGNTNGASTPTVLQGPIATRTLQVINGNSTAGATALALAVATGHSPMTVNSTTKVVNLNADKIDGIDSTNLASRAVVGFNLIGGGVSAAITLPAGRAVHVAGAVNTDLSAGQLTVFRVPAGPLGVLIWTGTSWIGGASAAWGGSSSTAGFVMVNLASDVAIEVASPTAIRIHNFSASQRTGYVTLIW